MNAKICLLAVFAAGSALSGCTTMDGAAMAAAPAHKPATPGTMYQPRIKVDDAYVSYVESVARRRGVTVQWVNMPVKRHVDDQKSDQKSDQ